MHTVEVSRHSKGLVITITPLADLSLLLSEANAALQCFINDMKLQGIWEDVTIVSASEFGRTLTSNGAGTDHEG